MNNKKHVIRRLLGYIKPYKGFLVLSLISSLMAVLSTLFFPMIVGDAVDALATLEWTHFFNLLIVLVVIAAFTALFQYLLSISNNKLVYSISKNIREEVFAHIQKLPLSYLDSHPQGDIVSRVISDADQITDGLLMGFTQLFTGVLTILGTLICLFSINYIVALVVVLVTPISLFTASFIAKRSYTLFHKQSKARGEQTAYMDEMITGSGVVELFNRERISSEHFDELDKEWAGYSLFATFYSSLVNPVTRFVNSVVYTGVALSGGLFALMGYLSVGSLFSILSYASSYTKPFNEITGVLTELQNAIASAERLFDLIDEKEEDKEKDDKLENVDGNVAIENVEFSYTKDKKLIENFSIDVKKGMKIALVGPTGCGKTTVINLLMRFYDVDSGSISIDGKDIREVTRESLRKSYGMVLQETWLKNCSIRDNIRYAKPDATDEEVKRAAKVCHIDNFIESLPNGYDEIIGDESEDISAGQKQLLCIARVILAEPDILILDEATSSIDTRTELFIQEAFGTLMEGHTSFVVAHRLSTIKSSDAIIVMKDGHILEIGDHETLLKNKGFYSELYNSQFA